MKYTDQLTFTPEQVAQILQLNKVTIYQLIKKGEIIAKKLGNTFRIPRSSISFVFEGLDSDIIEAEQKDLEALPKIRKVLKDLRSAKG